MLTNKIFNASALKDSLFVSFDPGRPYSWLGSSIWMTGVIYMDDGSQPMEGKCIFSFYSTFLLPLTMVLFPHWICSIILCFWFHLLLLLQAVWSYIDKNAFMLKCMYIRMLKVLWKEKLLSWQIRNIGEERSHGFLLIYIDDIVAVICLLTVTNHFHHAAFTYTTLTY